MSFLEIIWLRYLKNKDRTEVQMSVCHFLFEIEAVSFSDRFFRPF